MYWIRMVITFVPDISNLTYLTVFSEKGKTLLVLVQATKKVLMKLSTEYYLQANYKCTYLMVLLEKNFVAM